MKVFFVSAGGNGGIPKDVVRNQGVSLVKQGIEVRYFCVKGKGLLNYFGSVPLLRKELKSFQPDIIHAHYSFSGFLAYLSCARPLVVSLMGSDANRNLLLRFATKLFVKYFWDLTIVKSAEMKDKLNIEKAFVLPNGVDTQLFRIKDKTESANRSGLDLHKKNILFLADPRRLEKNFLLAKASVKSFNKDEVNLVPVFNIPNSDLCWYYNAADLLLMTSLWEGSPNVVKEAMACNLPVVSTGVGDVKELLEGVAGCYICSFDPTDVAAKIKAAFEFNKKTNGREKIFRIELDSQTIAKRLVAEYLKVIAHS